MSIAALLQAAEYIERRDRGEFREYPSILCIGFYTSTWPPSIFVMQESADFDGLVYFCLQKLSMDTLRLYRFRMISGAWSRGPSRKSHMEAGKSLRRELPFIWHFQIRNIHFFIQMSPNWVKAVPMCPEKVLKIISVNNWKVFLC